MRTRSQIASQRPARSSGGTFAAAALDRGAEPVVRVDDQRGEQVVAAREVAVDGRRHHADLAGDGAQRERGRALLGELAAGGGEDLLGELGPDPGAGTGGGGHARHRARFREQ